MESGMSGRGNVSRRDADCAAQLQHAAFSTQASAIIIAAEDGAITFWNIGANACSVTRRMIGRPISVLVESNRSPPSMDEFAGDPLTNRQAVCTKGAWYRQKHGGLVYGLGTTVSIDAMSGRSCVWFIRDATLLRKERLPIERRLLEQEQAVNEVRRANAAKDRFLAVMSHELKQPLTELLLSAELLLQLTPSEENRKLHALGQTMRCAARRQARVIDDLFELSRIAPASFAFS